MSKNGNHQYVVQVVAPSHPQIAQELLYRLPLNFPNLAVHPYLPGGSGMRDAQDAGLCLLVMDAWKPENFEAIVQFRQFGYQVIVIGQGASREAILSLFRAGARDYVEWFSNDQDGLLQAVEKYLRDVQPARKSPRCVAILGANGGVGTTSLVANLGAGLGLKQHNTVLVDLAQRAGDLANFLNLVPDHSLEELIHSQFVLEEELLRQSLAEFNERVSLLSARDDIYEAGEWADQTQLLELLKQAVQMSSYTLLDLGGRRPEFVVDLIPAIHLFVAPFQANLVSLRRLRVLLKILLEAGVKESEILLVENRQHEDSTLSRHQIEKILRHPIDLALPEESKTFANSLNCGSPILPQEKRTAAGKAIQQLVDQVMERLHGKQVAAALEHVGGIRKLAACLGLM